MILPTHPTFLLHAGGGRRVPRDPAPFLGLPPKAGSYSYPTRRKGESEVLGRRRKPQGTQDPSEDRAESVISLEPKRSLNSDGLLQRTQADGKVCPVEVLRSDRQTLTPFSRKPHTCPLNRFSQLHRPGDLSSSSPLRGLGWPQWAVPRVMDRAGPATPGGPMGIF